MRVPTQSDKDVTCSTFSSQNTDQGTEEDAVRESSRIAMQRQEDRWVTAVSSHLPSSEDVTPGEGVSPSRC